MRVLFVDDEPAGLDGLRRSLRGQRSVWDMSFHTSAHEAVDALAKIDEAVVVTDWLMPDIDGIELCRKLRELEAANADRRYYVILLTGIQGVEAAVDALDEGADEFVRKPFDSRELTARIRVGMRLLAAEGELRSANRELNQLATTDGLTNLINRRRADEILNEEVSRVARSHQSLGVLLIDIDHFKTFNDRFGHAAGDEVLRVTSSRLESVCRAYDSVARWGGEEFLVLCPSTGQINVLSIGERLRRVICESPVSIAEGQQAEVSVSVGAILAPAGSVVPAAELARRADEQLFAAKHAGRNRVCVYDPSSDCDEKQDFEEFD